MSKREKAVLKIVFFGAWLCVCFFKEKKLRLSCYWKNFFCFPLSLGFLKKSEILMPSTITHMSTRKTFPSFLSDIFVVFNGVCVDVDRKLNCRWAWNEELGQRKKNLVLFRRVHKFIAFFRYRLVVRSYLFLRDFWCLFYNIFSSTHKWHIDLQKYKISTVWGAKMCDWFGSCVKS